MAANPNLPKVAPPGVEWRWAIVVDGPHEGTAMEIPAIIGYGRRVRCNEGVFAVGPMIANSEIRTLYWWDY